MTTTLSKNLQGLMSEQKLNTSELSRRTGLGQPVIYRMYSGETDNPKLQTLIPLAKYFEVTVSQLIGDTPLPMRSVDTRHGPQRIGWHEVPELSWEQVAKWPENVDKTQIEILQVTHVAVSEKTYALRVKDSTMEPKFSEGTLIFIDPEIKPADQGFAVITFPDETEPCFRQVFYDGNTIYFKPINPVFETRKMQQKDCFRLHGTVIEARMNL